MASLHGSFVLAAPREVRVGVYENEPKIFMGSNGQPSGILGDLLAEMAQREQWKLVPVQCEWQQCLDALKSGELDLMPDVAFNPARDTLFDFHKVPALLSWSQIYKRSGVSINSALDLKGKRIAVLNGSVQKTYLADLLKGFGIEAEFVQVSNFKEGFEQVAAGSADAAAVNRFYGDLHTSRYQLESTPILFQPAQLFYATTQGKNAQLLASIDTYLERWGSQQDSPYHLILKRWMEGPPKFSIPTYVWWGLSALVLMFSGSMAVNFLLRREVARKTRSLQASEDKLATILNSVGAFIYIKGLDLRYEYVNRKVSELFCAEPTQIVGQSDASFFDAQTVEKLRANDLKVLQDGVRVEAEEINRSADGSHVRTFLSVKLPLRRDDGTIYGLCGISTDITSIKEAEEAIHQLAYYDPLTKLPNRRLLLEHVHAALASSERRKDCGALLFVDVDNFKDLNDTLGHHVGDILLQQMAQRLGGCTRSQDMVARQGGDEFVVMLQGLGTHIGESVQQARQVAEKIVQRLSEPYYLEDKEFKSSVSLGVAMFSGDVIGQEDLLKQADLAMYRAKADGRNRVCFFDPHMQAQVNERTAIETDLREGIVQSQFVLYYQPQFRFDGSQIGVEALVRWRHPQRGLVAPGVFIPVAESSGLILPLGKWILLDACRQAVRWSADPAKSGWVISINVSAKQFKQPDFVQHVRDALKSSGAQANRIELELTESQLVDDLGSVVAKMTALKELGVRLSLDDFGTGYSSLSMLKNLPLDELKIDQSFVRDLLADAQDRSIVRAILTMGESMGLRVIAEGVETDVQRGILLELGCKYFQGYLLGHPAPAD
ncbi:MAG TPA: EAL domain-containing protein [Rhodoferax sp.]|nr:EAL domain-containing protein [Rhodoferax sp.]HPW30186.1 EAL domain-containing protein [Rhodoferax sp.]